MGLRQGGYIFVPHGKRDGNGNITYMGQSGTSATVNWSALMMQ